MGKRAVFLDRDGTIIVEKNYLADPNQVVLLEGASRAIRLLSEAGFLIVMVSNQSGVARGMFTERQVELVNARTAALLREEGAAIDAVYYCPHHEKGSVPEYAIACNCRKPSPGMGLAAAKELGINLSESFMVGDKESDVEFGRRCGMRQAYLVRTGHGETEHLLDEYGVVLEDILQAAEHILHTEKH